MVKRADIGEERRRWRVQAAVCVMAAAVAAAVLSLADGAAPAAVSAAAGPALGDAGRWLNLLGTCLLTALVEELVFRGLLLRAVVRVCTPRATILITAGIFAAFHGLPIGIEGTPDLALVVASLLLKCLEALAFGIVLAAILFCGGTLPGVIALHAAFDIVYFADPVLATGDFPATYVVTDPAGFAALIAATLLLAILAIWAMRFPESSLSLNDSAT